MGAAVAAAYAPPKLAPVPRPELQRRKRADQAAGGRHVAMRSLRRRRGQVSKVGMDNSMDSEDARKLIDKPRFPCKGVSLNVLTTIAAYIRGESMRGGGAVEQCRINEVWERYLKPLTQPFLAPITATPTDYLCQLPFGVTPSDFQVATHFVIANGSERFLDLVARLIKYAEENDTKVSNKFCGTMYFWLPCCCLNWFDVAGWSAAAFLCMLREGMRQIDRVICMLLRNDCATRNSGPAIGLRNSIECLAMLSVAAMEGHVVEFLLQDADAEENLHAAILEDVSAVLDRGSEVKSVKLSDQLPTTRYFEAVACHMRGGHEALDGHAHGVLRGWLYDVAGQCLQRELAVLDPTLSAQRTGKQHCSRKACRFVLAMASLTENESETRWRWENEEWSRILQRVLECADNVYGVMDAISIDIAKAVADRHMLLEEWQAAEPLLRRIILGARHIKDHDLELNTKEVLGKALTNMGVYDEAEQCFRETAGPGSAAVLECMEKRARRLQRQGKSDAARKIFGDVVRECRRETAEHPATLASAYEIAMHLLDKGTRNDIEQAETLLRRILACRRAALSSKSPQVVVVASKLFHLQWKQHKWVAACEFYDLLAHVNDPQTQARLGIVKEHAYIQSGNEQCRQESRVCLETCLKLVDANPGAKTADSLSAVACLGRQEQEAGNLDRASKLFRRYMVNNSRGNMEVEEYRRVVADLAWCYMGLDRPVDAEPLFRQLFMNYATKYGEDHSLTARMRSRLADCLDGQGREDEARKLYRINAEQEYVIVNGS